MQKKQSTKIELLEKKNKELEKKLKHAQEWMKKSVEETDDVIHGDIEEVHVGNIKEKVKNFLGDFPLGSNEENIIDDLISSEILYYHMEQDPHLDGTGVIIGYNKAIDFVIEEYITSPFRKFAIARCSNMLKSSNHIEKNLHLTIHKGYMLSIGRLFEVLQAIHNNYEAGFYTDIFKEFLDTYKYIQEFVFEEKFYQDIQKLIDGDIFGSKRHSGSIELIETQEVRKKLMGDFIDTDCIFIKLISLGKTF